MLQESPRKPDSSENDGAVAVSGKELVLLAEEEHDEDNEHDGESIVQLEMDRQVQLSQGES